VIGSLVQGAIVGFGLLRVGAGLSDGRGRPEAVSRWSARSEARTYDLDAVEDGRMMACGASGDLDMGLAGLGLLGRGGLGVRAGAPCLISVLEQPQLSGDVMIDGVIPVVFCGRSIFQSRPAIADDRNMPGADRRTSVELWARRAWVSSAGWRPGGVAQGAQGVMGSAGQLAGHR
jgi:hypothetical protein